MGKKDKAKQSKTETSKKGTIKPFKLVLKEKAPVLKFFGVFVLVIALFYIMVAVFNEKIFDPYINVTASLAALFIKIFNSSVHATAGVISSSTCSLTLSFGCEGSEPLVLFIAGCLAFPTPWKLKLIGLGIGIVSLYLMNIFRIAGLYFIMGHWETSFSMFHDVIFPVIFIFISIIVWGGWVQWSQRKIKKS